MSDTDQEDTGVDEVVIDAKVRLALYRVIDHGDGHKAFRMSGFHEDCASVPELGIDIQSSLHNRMHFPIHDHQVQGSNGLLVMTVDVQPAIEAAISKWREELAAQYGAQEATNDPVSLSSPRSPE